MRPVTLRLSIAGLAAGALLAVAAPAAAAPIAPMSGPALAVGASDSLIVPVHGYHCSRQYSHHRGWHSHCYKPRVYYAPRYKVRPYYKVRPHVKFKYKVH
jgi:hypothetical protein